MKRFSLFLLLSCLAIQVGLAAPRSYTQAKEIAIRKALQLGTGVDFYQGQQTRGEVVMDGKAYYAFNNVAGKGFTLVSGDDRMPEVIGYATTGSFSEDNMPIQMKALLSAYEQTYEALQDNDLKALAVADERQALAVTRAAANIKVNPLLGSIAWNQGNPYNLLCPVDGTENSVTGCVATAMAQIIAYHKYPEILEAEIPAYTTRTKGFDMPAIPAGQTYDYAKMLPTYPWGASYTDEQAKAVATLMLHCGCSVKMNYTLGGSGANTYVAINSLVDYFGYDRDLINSVLRANCQLEEWCSILDNELDNNRPVLVSGTDIKTGGHAFICDGADGNGFYHINWGWGGYCNGYFDISLLNSDEPQTSTGSDGYNWGLGMIIGIAPDNGKTDEPLVESKDLFADVDSKQLTVDTRANASGKFSGDATVFVFNNLFETWTGWCALAIEKESGYTLISHKTNVTIPGRGENGYYYMGKTLTFSSAFPVGLSKICVVYGIAEGDPVSCVNFQQQAYFYINATETSATLRDSGGLLSATLTSDGPIVKESSNILTLSVTNDGVEECYTRTKIYFSTTPVKHASEDRMLLLTVPVGETTNRTIELATATDDDYYVWIEADDGTPLITAQRFSVAKTIDTTVGSGGSYWSTFSDQSSDVELVAPAGSSLMLYNVAVSAGRLTLTQRTGELASKVAKGEAVLIKTDAAEVTAIPLGKHTLSADEDNQLIATPDEDQVIMAEDDHLLYRLTYDDVATQKDLGFYLSVATVDETQYKDGTRLNATRGKGYLHVSKADATPITSSAPTRGFTIGDEGGTTAIEGITSDDAPQQNADRIYNLQGQQTNATTDGIYIKNNKKVMIR